MHLDASTPDGAALIPLRARDGSVRAYAIVDAADADWVNQWRWCLDGNGYASRGVRHSGRTRQFQLHRELLGLTRGDGFEGDHIDRNHLNCRRYNLRVVRRPGNTQNKSSYAGSTSAYRGVSWTADRGRWQAQIQVNGKKTHLGFFSDEHEAAEVARAARVRMMPFATN